MKRATSLYIDSAASEALTKAAAAQGLSKSAWLEEALLLVAGVSGAPSTATAAAAVWIRLRRAGNLRASNQVRSWALADASYREPLEEETLAALTAAELQALSEGLKEGK